MKENFSDFLLSPFGIFCCLLGLILFSPLIKLIVWKLFSFDNKVQEILSQKKSSEVRTGKVVESVAPLMKSFPVDITKEGTSTIFLGQPIDYVHFDPDEGITFIEVKSANSRFSTLQKKMIEHIEKGNVFWADMKVKGGED